MQSGIHSHDRKIVGRGHRERFNDVLYSLGLKLLSDTAPVLSAPKFMGKTKSSPAQEIVQQKVIWNLYIFETIPKTIQGYRGISADPQERRFVGV